MNKIKACFLLYPASLEQSKPNRSITATTQIVARSHPVKRLKLLASLITRWRTSGQRVVMKSTA
jgi:hypothetical protein